MAENRDGCRSWGSSYKTIQGRDVWHAETAISRQATFMLWPSTAYVGRPCTACSAYWDCLVCEQLARVSGLFLHGRCSACPGAGLSAR